MDGRGGYRKQMERTMEKAVSRGVMVPAHFHNKRDEMMEALASGVDDGRTRTQGVCEIKFLIRILTNIAPSLFTMFSN